MCDDLDAAAYIAETARKCWEPIWPGWKEWAGHPDPDGPPSQDVCIATSFPLREMLDRCVSAWNWHVVGGRPTKRTPRGGFWLPDGRGGPHLWVEGRRAGRRITADITGDQFGSHAVLVCEGVPDSYAANATRALLLQYERNERVTTELWTAVLAEALRLRADQADA